MQTKRRRTATAKIKAEDTKPKVKSEASASSNESEAYPNHARPTPIECATAVACLAKMHGGELCSLCFSFCCHTFSSSLMKYLLLPPESTAMLLCACRL